ncbi:TonB family protein [Stakelama saccharophila]|uniref:TonB family protein n=1 Tax=Stakelama saccharophila TaxID=3075605 RepID=A0ABZ0B675_9SPHN|nr:TonB family protein [Stakelama sp. W311]WNO52510.1 TonB family protein [Stakelama sp. W311]
MSDTDAGAALLPGPGTGAGGEGSGTGSGHGDLGVGGGVAIGSKRIAGTIDDADYPPSARAARAEGAATVQFIVGTDGRAHDCTVMRSSGNAALDATTCRLIEQRYRYRPARNLDGDAVPERRAWKQSWWLERGRGRLDRSHATP